MVGDSKLKSVEEGGDVFPGRNPLLLAVFGAFFIFRSPDSQGLDLFGFFFPSVNLWQIGVLNFCTSSSTAFNKSYVI